MVRADAIDILVDLGGHTAHNRLDLFAREPAPIQVSWLGYPTTTGLAAIDYRLTDAWADPPGAADAHYSERLIRLPEGFLCYGAPARSPDIGPPPCMERGFVTFGSFNNLTKVRPEVVALWAEILLAVPNARLVLKAQSLDRRTVRERTVQAFAERGVAPERIDCVGWIASSDILLAAYGRLDVALDPFPYNGTTTTCEALWMGVPVIVLGGVRHSARVGVSLLHQVGLTELIAETPERYVEIATMLARDVARIADYRNGLRACVAGSPLTDARGFARRIETAYRTMWRRWCAQTTA